MPMLMSSLGARSLTLPAYITTLVINKTFNSLQDTFSYTSIADIFNSLEPTISYTSIAS
jgi:hypothetical protein